VSSRLFVMCGDGVTFEKTPFAVGLYVWLIKSRFDEACLLRATRPACRSSRPYIIKDCLEKLHHLSLQSLKSIFIKIQFDPKNRLILRIFLVPPDAVVGVEIAIGAND